MALEILAFSLATVNLAVVCAMLVVGLADLPDYPVSTRCQRCSRWTINMDRTPTRICLRCRLHSSSGQGIA